MGSGTLPEDISQTRRAVAAASVLGFAKLYLPGHVGLPWSALHRDIDRTVRDAVASGKRRILVSAPDGYGKTTVGALAAPLWLLAGGHARHVALVHASAAQAGQHLAAMRDAIRAAPFLRSDHPALSTPARGTGAHARTPRSLALRGGQMLSAHGMNPGPRALAGSGRAPDLYVLEAPDPAPTHMEAHWRTTDRYRYRMHQWLDKELESLPGDPIVIVLGARSVQGSLVDIARETLQDDRWAVIAHKAVVRYPAYFDEWFQWGAIYHRQTDFDNQTGPDAAARYLEQNREPLLKCAEVLWPEHESLEDLMLYRARRGWASFDAEKQGVPPGSKGCSVHVGETGGDPTRCIDDAGYARVSQFNVGPAELERLVLRVEPENPPARRKPPRFGEQRRGDGFKVRVMREDEVDTRLPHEREF